MKASALTRALGAAAIITTALALAACGGGDDKVKVGAVLDLSEGWTSLGKQAKAALEDSASEFQRRTGKTIDVRIEDATGDPNKAADLVGKLADDGYLLIVGPGGSAEAESAAPVAKQKGAVLISPGSTASALAKSNDGLIRFVPDDRIEAKAIVALMDKQGVDTLVPVWRTDLGNQGLHDSVTAAWAKLRGSSSVAKGVSYPASKTTGFSSLAPAVSKAVEGASGDGRTAVYLAGFGEAAGIVSAIKGAGADVNWYGGDGLVGDSGFTGNAATAKSTAALCLPSPQFGLDPATKAQWAPVLAQLAKANDGQSDAFGVVAYDAANVAINVMAGPGKGKDGVQLERVVWNYSNSTTGASGPLSLNEYGDRKTGDYDYWQVRTGGKGQAKWTVTGSWKPSGGQSGTVVRSAACSF